MEKNFKVNNICLIGLLLLLVSSRLTAQEFEILPDGTPFPFWSDVTKYSKVYHVAQNNPKASDENSGTLEKPLKTINAAARLLKPGEKVIVHEGIYRECIRPSMGGTAADKMITYEAAAGEKVIIKGSEIWKPDIKSSAGWSLRRNEGGKTIWMADIPEDYFKAYNPFLVRNAYHYLSVYGVVSEKEWLDRAMLFRGMVFADGVPLKQVYDIRELTRTDNAFWVEDPGLRLHFRLRNDDDPAKHLIEITTREQIFAPRDYGIGYIRVSGFVFEHAADGLPVPQRAAVSTMRGHHWIIENNSIDWANACGLNIGAQSWDATLSDLYGYHIIRKNTIRNCGICGIAGAYGVEHTLIEGNIIEKIGTLNLERMWECMAIKFHYCKHSLIRNNIIRHLSHAGGLWLDCNTNCRITNNVFADIQSVSAALYSEMNYDINLVDNNIFWDIRFDQSTVPDNSVKPNSAAVRADCNEKLVVTNNFFGKIENHAVSFTLLQSNRRHEGRTGLCNSNVAVNNLFYQCPKRIYLARQLQNKIDGNLYDQSMDNYSFILEYPAPLNYQNFAGWQEYFGYDKNSTQAKIQADFDVESCILKVKIEGKMPECETLISLINGKVTTNNPGPFRTGFVKDNSGLQTIECKFPL